MRYKLVFTLFLISINTYASFELNQIENQIKSDLKNKNFYQSVLVIQKQRKSINEKLLNWKKSKNTNEIESLQSMMAFEEVLQRLELQSKKDCESRKDEILFIDSNTQKIKSPETALGLDLLDLICKKN